MAQGFSDQSYRKQKTVVLLAECWNGAFDAGRFAAKVLFDNNTRIVLLHTYQRPLTGVSLMRDLAQILRQTAEQDLFVLKTKLVKEFGLPVANIEEVVVEANLKSVIEDEFSKHPNLSIVLGPDIQNPYRRGSCKKIVRALLDSRTRPVFLVSDFITIVEESRIICIAEKEEDISPVFLNFLKTTIGDDNKIMEIITNDNENTIKIDRDTASHFSNELQPSDLGHNSMEQIFYNRVVRVSPV